MNKQLVLIHLSDIHFRHFKNGNLDLDEDLRNEMLLDIIGLSKNIGHVNGVLVSGDIAFSGKANEYEIASRWLVQLCSQLGCPPENVWVIPGNHDVDRSIIQSSGILQMIHDDLRPDDPAYVDIRLKHWLDDPQAKDLLFTPIENYNLFARRFGCQSNSDNVYWQHDLTLNDGSMLRIRGMNSALISGALDNTRDRKLVVGGFQSILLREAGVVYLTMCHHPADWIIDADTLTDGLDNRATIQLFGHKHKQRFREIGTKGLCIAAGAIHPDRGEAAWQPRYNILEIDVRTQETIRSLHLTVWPRIWRDDLRQFVADVGVEATQSKTFEFPLSPWAGSSTPSSSSVSTSEVVIALDTPSLQSEVLPTSDTHPAASDTKESVMVSERRLMYRFFGLSYAQIIKIAASLDLLSDDDAGLRDTERFQRFYRRAQEREQLAELWTQVEERYGDNKTLPNPFLKPKATEV